MAVLMKKSVATIFLLGMVVLAILSLVGMVYLTQMAFDTTKLPDGKYPGNMDDTQRNIAKLSIVVLWMLLVWILIGSFIQKVWE